MNYLKVEKLIQDNFELLKKIINTVYISQLNLDKTNKVILVEILLGYIQNRFLVNYSDARKILDSFFIVNRENEMKERYQRFKLLNKYIKEIEDKKDE